MSRGPKDMDSYGLIEGDFFLKIMILFLYSCFRSRQNEEGGAEISHLLPAPTNAQLPPDPRRRRRVHWW